MIRNESDILNVGMSKLPKVASRPAVGLRGAVSAPAGYGAGLRSKTYVSKWTHGFFITINSMILYFKHIIHIDNFPLNGHPPTYYNSNVLLIDLLILICSLSLCVCTVTQQSVNMSFMISMYTSSIPCSCNGVNTTWVCTESNAFS